MNRFLLFILALGFVSTLAQTKYSEFRYGEKYGIATYKKGSYTPIDTVIVAKYDYIYPLRSNNGFLLINEELAYKHYRGVTYIDSNLYELNHFEEITDLEDLIAVLKVGNEEQLFDLKSNKAVSELADSISVLEICIPFSLQDNYAMYGSQCKGTVNYFSVANNQTWKVYDANLKEIMASNAPVRLDAKFNFFVSGNSYYFCSGQKIGDNVDSVEALSKVNQWGEKKVYLRINSSKGTWHLCSGNQMMGAYGKNYYYIDKQLELTDLPKNYIFSRFQVLDDHYIFSCNEGYAILRADGQLIDIGIVEDILFNSEYKHELLIVKKNGKYYALDQNGVKIPDFEWDDVKRISSIEDYEQYFLATKDGANYVINAIGQKVYEEVVKDAFTVKDIYSNCIVLINKNDQHAFRKFDGTFTPFGNPKAERIDTISNDEYLEIFHFKGAEVISYDQYYNDMPIHKIVTNGNIRCYEQYYENGVKLAEGKLIRNTDSLFLSSYPSSWIPYEYMVEYDDYGDTIRLCHFDDSNPRKYFLEYERLAPKNLIEYSYSERYINGEYTRVLNSKRSFSFNDRLEFYEAMIPDGWHTYWDDYGRITKNILYRVCENETLELLMEDWGEYPHYSYPARTLEYYSNGQLQSEYAIGKNITFDYYDSLGNLYSKHKITIERAMEVGKYEWDQSRYFLNDKEYVDLDENDLVTFHDNNRIKTIAYLDQKENLSQEREYWLNGKIKKEKTQKEIKLYDSEGNYLTSYSNTRSGDIDFSYNTEFVELLPHHTEGTKVNKKKVQYLANEYLDTLFFYQGKLLAYKQYDFYQDTLLKRSYDFAANKGFELFNLSKPGSFKNYKIHESGQETYEIYWDAVLGKKQLINQQDELYTYEYDTLGSITRIDSMGLEVYSQYSYVNGKGFLHSRTVSFKDKRLSEYEFESSESLEMSDRYYEKKETVYDSITGISTSVRIYKNQWNDADTTITTYQKQDGKFIGLWEERTYSENRLLSRINYSDSYKDHDTLMVLMASNADNIVKIITVDLEQGLAWHIVPNSDTICYQLNCQNHIFEEHIYNWPSTYEFIIKGDCAEFLWYKKYYSNGRITFELYKDSLFNIYYPNGQLASDDYEFNMNAKAGWQGQSIYGFDFKYGVFGEGKNLKLSENVKLMIPKELNFSYFSGDPLAKYFLVDRDAIYDKRQNKIVHYFQHLEASTKSLDGGYQYYNGIADNPIFLKGGIDGHVPFHFITSHDKKNENKWTSSFCANVSPDGNYILQLVTDDYNPSEPKKLYLIIESLPSYDTVKIIELDTADYYLGSMDDAALEFLDDDRIYISLFKTKNVFSLSQEKFVDFIDLDLYRNHIKLTQNSYWDPDLSKTMDSIEVLIETHDNHIISIEDDRLIPDNIRNAFYYQSDRSIVFLDRNEQLYKYDYQKRQLDTIGKDILTICSWGSELKELDIIQKNTEGIPIRVKPIKKDTASFIFLPVKLKNITFEQDRIQFNDQQIKTPLTGLNSTSGNYENETSLDIRWEASFINKEIIEQAYNVHEQEGKLIYIPEDSSSIYFYNSNKKDKLERHIELFPIENSEYLFLSPEHYYAMSNGIGNRLYYVKDYKPYPLEQFDLKYNRPDIILDRLGYADSSLVAAYHHAYQKRLKKMGFTEEMLEDDFHLPEIKINNYYQLPTLTDSPTMELNIHIEDSKYLLDRLNIWINNVAVYGSEGISVRDLETMSINKKVMLPLVNGINKIQLSVLNQAGAESYKETFEVTSTFGKEQPDLYLITIGESEFQQSDYNLTYAAKDAEDVASLLAKSKVYKNVFFETITNQEVTRDNVLALKEFLKKADINDQVIIFVAGHGILSAELDYYLATYDIDFNMPEVRGLMYEDLESLLDGIKPLKKTLILDACHSGEIDKEDVELVALENTTNTDVQFRTVGNAVQNKLDTQNTLELTKSLFTDLRKGTGATVISSAGGMEFAMESGEWKNGLFTYVLLDGIQSGKADLNKDQEIWLSELQVYLAQEVVRLSNGKQQPTSRIENQMMDFRIW